MFYTKAVCLLITFYIMGCFGCDSDSPSVYKFEPEAHIRLGRLDLAQAHDTQAAVVEGKIEADRPFFVDFQIAERTGSREVDAQLVVALAYEAGAQCKQRTLFAETLSARGKLLTIQRVAQSPDCRGKCRIIVFARDVLENELHSKWRVIGEYSFDSQ